MINIIIPVYNQLELTKQCVNSIYENTNDYKICIIDNGSTDGTFEWLKKQTKLTYARNPINEGFARAVNSGIKYSDSEYICLLNNDTIVTKDWLTNLLKPFKDKSVGITGSLLLFPNTNIVQHAGCISGMFATKGLEDCVGFQNIGWNTTLKSEHLVTKEVEAVTGACMLISREVINKIGYFDIKYKNSCEDIDYCLRAKQLGFKIVYCGDSLVYHYEGRTEGRNDNNIENIKYFNDKWKVK